MKVFTIIGSLFFGKNAGCSLQVARRSQKTNHGFSSDSDAAFRRNRFKLTTTLRETLSA